LVFTGFYSSSQDLGFGQPIKPSLTIFAAAWSPTSFPDKRLALTKGWRGVIRGIEQIFRTIGHRFQSVADHDQLTALSDRRDELSRIT
jgi:hypothetical protein